MKGFYGFLIILAFVVTGCGSNILEWAADDESREAKLEEARMALDDSDYEKARLILEGMNTTDYTVAKYLSDAYAGRAGIDTFNLLKTIDELNETKNVGAIDMVGKVLGGDDATLTATEIKSKISDLTQAIDYLGTPQTDEEKAQLGLLSISHAGMLIAQIISEGNNNANVILTEEGITDAQTANINILPGDSRLTLLTTDIQNINNSIEAISRMTGTTTDENDLSKNFNQFKNELNTDKDNKISDTELKNYIINNL